MRGFNPLSSFLLALEYRDSGKSGRFDAEAAQNGVFRSKQDCLSVLSAGPAALDLLVTSAPVGSDIELPALDAPGALVAFALLAAQQSDANIRLTWPGESQKALCRSWELSLVGGRRQDIVAAGPLDITLRRLDASARDLEQARPVPPSSDVLRDGADVDSAQWQRLYALAERRLVAGTEASRLAGAGAGLVDRD